MLAAAPLWAFHYGYDQGTIFVRLIFFVEKYLSILNRSFNWFWYFIRGLLRLSAGKLSHQGKYFSQPPNKLVVMRKIHIFIN